MMKKMLALVMMSFVSLGYIGATEEQVKISRNNFQRAGMRRKNTQYKRKNAMSGSNLKEIVERLRKERRIEALRAELREELRKMELRETELREELRKMELRYEEFGKQKVMAFDFDLTLINGHTGGFPYGKDHMTKKPVLNVLSDSLYREYLQKLQMYGFKIVVITRGIEEDVARALNEAGLSDIIAPQDVYGASMSPSDHYSHGYEQPGRPQRTGINKPDEWVAKKVEYLNYIVFQYHTTKDNVYFYDDTALNVIAAQHNGFEHSYVVDVENHVNGIDLLKSIVAEQERMNPVKSPAKKRRKMNAMTHEDAKRMGEQLRQQQQMDIVEYDDVDMYPAKKKVVHFGEDDLNIFDDTEEDVEARKSIEVDQFDFEDRY
ncbi:hypothetical protein K9K77_03000 [Candidatus Babeliales bacterium]|nr:hypothetical protein [Candidatus Babeliales bacterium]